MVKSISRFRRPENENGRPSQISFQYELPIKLMANMNDGLRLLRRQGTAADAVEDTRERRTKQEVETGKET